MGVGCLPIFAEAEILETDLDFLYSENDLNFVGAQEMWNLRCL